MLLNAVRVDLVLLVKSKNVCRSNPFVVYIRIILSFNRSHTCSVCTLELGTSYKLVKVFVLHECMSRVIYDIHAVCPTCEINSVHSELRFISIRHCTQTMSMHSKLVYYIMIGSIYPTTVAVYVVC